MFGLGLALGGFIGTIVGVVFISMVVVGKESDARMGIKD